MAKKTKKNSTAIPAGSPAPVAGKRTFDYLRGGVVIEQHEMTPAQAAKRQAELRAEGYTDAEFKPAK